jgi:hypothetical protein
MHHGKRTASFLALAFVATAVFLSSCSGGGGGGGGGALILITAEGASAPLWELVNGAPSVPASCPVGVFINGRITFTFDGAVDPASLPVSAFAIGSITIVSEVTNIPALGTFAIQDDPAFPAGNNRRVVFTPQLPSTPGSQCAAGVQSFQNYAISVPFGTTSPQVIVVDGERIETGATTCFRTCGCPTGGGCVSPFMDAVAGAPFVTSTTPTTSDPAPPPITPCIAGNTVQIHVNEPLDPSGINLQNVRLINTQTMAQVPGSLVFHQATTVDGPSQIDYVASSQLLGSVTYEILLSPSVTDFGGNPIQPVQGNPTAHLFFATIQVPTFPQAPLVENFDTPNPGGVAGAATWSGNGFLQATFPIEITGTGADGGFSPAAGLTTIIDTAQLVNGQPRMGIWNFTNVNIPATATVRVIGPYQAHIRCTGAVTVNGNINANAATGLANSPNVYDRGPEMGIQNNNGGLNCEANGGVANAGGGAGGTGSGVTPPPGSPPTFQCTIRTQMGERGFGPTLSGVLNPGTPPNPYYAGGQGGDSGCFPAAGVGCAVGDLGGLGGAGGSAGRIGEAGLPRVSTVACTPNPSVTQPIAQPSPISPLMVPPINTQSAGSGGGGGGDHLESTGTPPNNDDQGAGGGGGGGGLRISSVGAYTQGPGATIQARGAQGNTAQASGGGGGSGSGGEVWIQTFSTVTIDATATIDVDGPVRLSPTVGAIGCSNQAAGGGGDGLVQIEAGQGPPATPSFMLLPTPTPTTGAVFSAPPFAFGGTVTGTGFSNFQFVGVPAPDYTSAVVVSSLGNAPGATIVVRFEGAQEAVNSTPQNPVFDPATIKSMATGGGLITPANIDELDGYSFIRWFIDLSYAAPPATPIGATLPSVDSITINFNGQQPCP